MTTTDLPVKILDNLIEYERWSVRRLQLGASGLDYSEIAFYGVTFRAVLGPWKAGHRADCLFFDPIFGTLSESTGGALVRHIPVRLTETAGAAAWRHLTLHELGAALRSRPQHPLDKADLRLYLTHLLDVLKE